MTIEQLLQPRYKVIEEYPNSPFEIDDIFFVNQDEEYINPPIGIQPFKYPHLFKKLSWWEGRDIEDMPKYLKKTGMVDSAENPVPDIYVKVKKHFSAGNGEWRDDSIHIFCADDYWSNLKNCSYSYSGWEPATEDEYSIFCQISITPDSPQPTNL